MINTDKYPATSSDVLKSLERSMTAHQEIWNLTPLSALPWMEHPEEFKLVSSNCLVIVRVLYLRSQLKKKAIIGKMSLAAIPLGVDKT